MTVIPGFFIPAFPGAFRSILCPLARYNYLGLHLSGVRCRGRGRILGLLFYHNNLSEGSLGLSFWGAVLFFRRSFLPCGFVIRRTMLDEFHFRFLRVFYFFSHVPPIFL
jgi:hypothetical protein